MNEPQLSTQRMFAGRSTPNWPTSGMKNPRLKHRRVCASRSVAEAPLLLNCAVLAVRLVTLGCTQASLTTMKSQQLSITLLLETQRQLLKTELQDMWVNTPPVAKVLIE
ncbi:hypothetical protein D3C85_1386750 [compost metagenome]